MVPGGLEVPSPLAGERDLGEGGRREVLENVLERFGECFGRFWKVSEGFGRFREIIYVLNYLCSKFSQF